MRWSSQSEPKVSPSKQKSKNVYESYEAFLRQLQRCGSQSRFYFAHIVSNVILPYSA